MSLEMSLGHAEYEVEREADRDADERGFRNTCGDDGYYYLVEAIFLPF
jgi:hypothetical protein